MIHKLNNTNLQMLSPNESFFLNCVLGGFLINRKKNKSKGGTELKISFKFCIYFYKEHLLCRFIVYEQKLRNSYRLYFPIRKNVLVKKIQMNQLLRTVEYEDYLAQVGNEIVWDFLVVQHRI